MTEAKTNQFYSGRICSLLDGSFQVQFCFSNAADSNVVHNDWSSRNGEAKLSLIPTKKWSVHFYSPYTRLNSATGIQGRSAIPVKECLFEIAVFAGGRSGGFLLHIHHQGAVGSLVTQVQVRLSVNVHSESLIISRQSSSKVGKKIEQKQTD